MESMVCQLFTPGLVEYRRAWNKQKVLHDARCRGDLPDCLILLEHPTVVTMGRAAKDENLLTSVEKLTEMGIDVVQVERGGDVTVHCPGQLVAYPIIRLADHGLGVASYVRLLEEMAIGLLGKFGICGQSVAGRPGVWIGDRKIAFVGVAVRRGVTLHGISLNVDTDREVFSMINPCGLGCEVTSMSSQNGEAVSVALAAAILADEFSKRLGVLLARGEGTAEW